MAHYKVNTSDGLVEFDADRADLDESEVTDIVNQLHPLSEDHQPSLAEMASSAVTSSVEPSKEGFIPRMVRATKEAILSPIAPLIPGMRDRALKPVMGQAGLTLPLEEAGASVENAVKGAASNIEYNHPILSELPPVKAPLFAAKMMAGGLRPSEQQLNIGMEPIGAVLGGAIRAGGSLIRGTGGVLKSGFRSLLASQKGTNRQVVDTVLDLANDATPAIKDAASEFLNKIRVKRDTVNKALGEARGVRVPGASIGEIQKSALELSKSLRKETYDLSEKAASALSDVPSISQADLVAPIDDLINSLKVEGQTFGQEGKRASDALHRWKSNIEGATKGSPPPPITDQFGRPFPGGPPKSLSEQQLKKITKFMDEDTVWDGVADESLKKVLRKLRGRYAGILDNNTAYKYAMSGIGKKIDDVNTLDDALGFEVKRGGETVAQDVSQGKIKSLVSGSKAEFEKTSPGIGLSDMVKSARDKMSGEKAKMALVKILEKESKTRYPLDYDVAQRAETAARQGIGSPAYQKLEKMLSDVLGETEGKKSAMRLMISSAKDIFSRSKGSTFSGLGVRGALSSSIAEESLSKLRGIDSKFKSMIGYGNNVSSFGEGVKSKSIPFLTVLQNSARRALGSSQSVDMGQPSPASKVIKQPSSVPGLFAPGRASSSQEAPVRGAGFDMKPKDAVYAKALEAFLAGDNQKASDLAYSAIQRNPNNLEAQQMLRRLAQKGNYGYRVDTKVTRTRR